MIKFLFKGIIRDRSRSLFPILIVAAGVLLNVFAYSWIMGYMDELIQNSAKFSTGHVKIMTRASAKQEGQISNDLAIIGVDSLLVELRKTYPNVIWTPRTSFGGLLDISGKNGETRAQGPVVGMAFDLLNKKSIEHTNFNLTNALVRGRLPEKPGEILVSDDFAKKLNVQPDETATLLSSTMYGSMAVHNYIIAGTVRFGVMAMDRGAMIADIADIRYALDMQDAAGAILGFFIDQKYSQEKANQLTADFNQKFEQADDEFSLVMSTLREQSGLAGLIDLLAGYIGIMIAVFVFTMSIVLWNVGLMSSLRRFGEIGVRLAIGERKGHLYRSLLAESLMVGFVGSSIGTILGLAAAYYMQIHGLDVSYMMQNSSMMISNVMRAKVTSTSYYIGFMPGLMATFLGTAISGIGIYRRQTSQLFKELEI